MIPYADGRAELQRQRARIEALHAEIRDLQAQIEAQPVRDYVFQTTRGERRLSDLFGDKNDLLVIHNMGRRCNACTMWADGFNGVYPQLARRTAFALSSPDAPDVQAPFAAERGWRFPIVSHAGSSFAADMGYYDEKEGFWPGVSAFHRGRPYRACPATPNSAPATTSVRYGTCSTCCRKAPRASATADALQRPESYGRVKQAGEDDARLIDRYWTT